MKPSHSSKKLLLKKETLRELSAAELADVDGGTATISVVVSIIVTIGTITWTLPRTH